MPPQKTETAPSQSDLYGFEALSESMYKGGEIFDEIERDEEKNDHIRTLLGSVESDEDALKVSKEDFFLIRGELQNLLSHEADNEELKTALEKGKVAILHYARKRITEVPTKRTDAEVSPISKAE